MASQRELKQEETLEGDAFADENPSISTRQVAQRVGISNGAAYYCGHGTGREGFREVENFTQSKTKSNYIYELTRGIRAKAALTVSFLERKEA